MLTPDAIKFASAEKPNYLLFSGAFLNWCVSELKRSSIGRHREAIACWSSRRATNHLLWQKSSLRATRVSHHCVESLIPYNDPHCTSLQTDKARIRRV